MIDGYMVSHLISDGTKCVVKIEPLNERKYQQIKGEVRGRVFDTIETGSGIDQMPYKGAW
jgi:hypothetical protein